jgi:O-antigen ligase
VIRLSLLAVYIGAAAMYAVKDWYKSLCALILLMAVVEHPDMPKTILGIQGLNPWNLLFLAVVATWISGRRREGLTWDLPPRITALLVGYLAVVLVGFLRMMADRTNLDDSAMSLTSENLVNTIKWVVPGLLLYDGCRTRERFRMAMLCVLGVYLLLGIQVIRWMPLSAAVNGDSLSERSLKILINEVGYHRVNMSAMLAGAAWAIFAARALGESTRQRALILIGSITAVFAQALTGGRAGYVTFAAVGFILCLLRWRVYLLLAPIAVAGILVVAPGVAQRMLEGFTPDTRSVPRRIQALEGTTKAGGPDAYTITAGRVIVWPFVIQKITERPWIGYGRLAMIRTGLTRFLSVQLDEGFSHPHNAYLEMLLDNGILGFVIVMPFYGLVLLYSIRLFRDSRSAIFVAVGGASSACILGLLIASMASQSFYPREGWVSMWCLIFLMLRVWVQRDYLLAAQATEVRSQASRPRALGPRVLAPVREPAVATAAHALPPGASRRPPPRALAPVYTKEPPAISEEALWGAGLASRPELPLGRPVRARVWRPV